MNINTSSVYSGVKQVSTVTATEKTEQSNVSTEPNVDTFTKTNTEDLGIYTKPQTNTVSVEELKEIATQQYSDFIDMLMSMVSKQGEQSNVSIMGMDLTVTEAQKAEAAASIAPGGEYSVDAVAGRIMDMAVALSGGDASKIEELREAVTAGFEAAGVELGGELPSISMDTYDEVMRRFDDWAAEANSATTVETEE